MNYFLNGMKNYANFKGRTTRKELWFYLLITAAIAAVCIAVSIIVTGGFKQPGNLRPWGMSPAAFGVTLAIILVFLCPTAAIIVRRLHDTGHSALWISFLVAFLLCSFFANSLGKEADAAPFEIAAFIFGFLSFILFVTNFILILCADSQHGENQYGPDPKKEAKTN